MREPAFWWQAPGLAAGLLRPLEWCYGAIAAARLGRGGAHAGIPVICVGNLTLGGAGKTPTAIAVAKLLKDSGETPFFLSRGYGGRIKGPQRVDPASHRAADVGDEPLLLARTAPAIVARDRVAGAGLAQAQGASVVVMDDGLQNASLVKDLTIAVIDGVRGIGNARVFPAGPLRAPLSDQLARCDALLVVGGDGATPPGLAGARLPPTLHAALVPDPHAAKQLAGQRVFAFAGIGHPEKFFATLRACEIDIAGTESFPDHHEYSDGDARRILDRCAAQRLVPVTTEKDMVRLAGGKLAELASLAHALPVTLVFDDEADIRRLLAGAIVTRRGRS
ncbi:MAG: tetraacyldisaccharide 4'-kinase [Pseudorhodoplanes sp.]|nr:tetraacyldisaccharide 4'-kinase [Pseudorhodoplanes sp.]